MSTYMFSWNIYKKISCFHGEIKKKYQYFLAKKCLICRYDKVCFSVKTIFWLLPSADDFCNICVCVFLFVFFFQWETHLQVFSDGLQELLLVAQISLLTSQWSKLRSSASFCGGSSHGSWAFSFCMIGVVTFLLNWKNNGKYTMNFLKIQSLKS